MQPKYKRILLKLSGEALAGDQRFGLNHEVIAPVVEQIAQIHSMGVEVGLVIGGGNFWRGRQGTNMDRTTADHMGMLATVMNSLAGMDSCWFNPKGAENDGYATPTYEIRDLRELLTLLG